MTLSKILVLAGTASAGIGEGRFPMLRALVDHQICESNFGKLEVDNGVVNCNGSVCELKTCDQGYHKLKTASGQSKKAKCISVKAGLKWNKDLLQCRTCSNLTPLADNDNFDVSCSFVNKAGYKLKKCSFQCKNGQKIQPANKKKMTNLMCKCMSTEQDDQCHWRKGSTAFDLGDEDDFDQWYCAKAPTEEPGTEPPVTEAPVTDEPVTEPPVTEAPVTEAPVTRPPVNRIPPNLKCSGTPHQKLTGGGNRIVGGLEAKENTWPWLTRLQVKASGQTFLCGGTIVDNKTIVTAAHCCDGADSIKAVTGEHSYFGVDEHEQKFTAASITKHPNYNTNTLENDVCVLKFENQGLKLATSEHADFACLNQVGSVIPEGTKCWTAGWGTLASGGMISDKLQEVDVDIISDGVCGATNNGQYYKTDTMMCAGHMEGGKDACQGDSGGPLICAIDDEPVLVGVTSWGLGCAAANSPGVWAEVANSGINQFIMDHVDTE